MQILQTLSLGPNGTILLTLVTLALAIITWWQRTWKSTSDAAVAELGVYKQANERLRAEKEAQQTQIVDLNTELAKMHAQTDLKPLIDSITNWITEGRSRFDAAKLDLDRIHSEQETAFKAILTEVSAQRVTSETAYRDLTQVFMTHTIDDSKFQLRLTIMMDAVERRLSDIAVKVGITQWSVAPGASVNGV